MNFQAARLSPQPLICRSRVSQNHLRARRLFGPQRHGLETMPRDAYCESRPRELSRPRGNAPDLRQVRHGGFRREILLRVPRASVATGAVPAAGWRGSLSCHRLRIDVDGRHQARLTNCGSLRSRRRNQRLQGSCQVTHPCPRKFVDCEG